MESETTTDWRMVTRSPSFEFVMVEYRRNAQRLFAATVRHRLVAAGGALRIAWKRVDLINCDAELEGLVLPF